MIIEIPLWLVIVFLSMFALLIVHNIIGDLLGKVLYNHLKKTLEEKENK